MTHRLRVFLNICLLSLFFLYLLLWNVLYGFIKRYLFTGCSPLRIIRINSLLAWLDHSPSKLAPPIGATSYFGCANLGFFASHVVFANTTVQKTERASIARNTLANNLFKKNFLPYFNFSIFSLVSSTYFSHASSSFACSLQYFMNFS